jgi:hypothetical protein
MGGLRRGLVTLAIAGSVATGGFIGGLALSGGPATAATPPSNSATNEAATTVAATATPSATPKSNEDSAHEKSETAAQEKAENNGTGRHNCPGHSGSSSSTTSSTSNA